MAPSIADVANAPLVSRRVKSFKYYQTGTFASLMFGYAGFYLCRQNFAASAKFLESGLGIDPMTFGSIATVGTVAYAIGKFVGGPIADRLGGRRVFLGSLFVSALMSLLIGVVGSVLALFFLLWGLNRFIQSFGWAGLVNIMPRWYSRDRYGIAMGAMATSYQFGGVVTPLLLGVLLAMGMGWQGLFIVPAVLLTILGLLVWRFLVENPEDVGLKGIDETRRDPEEENGPRKGDETSGAGDGQNWYVGMKKLVRRPAFWVVCGLSFVLTLLRESFATWMPLYFSDLGDTASAAVLKSTIFPLLGVAGTMFAGWFSDRFSAGRRGPIMTVFLLALVMFLVGLAYLDEMTVVVTAVLPFIDRLHVAVFLVGGAGFLIFGPYSMVGGGVVALDFGGREAASTAAGLLDGVGYLGASLAGIGVASMVAGFGWTGAYATLAVLAGVAVVLALPLWKTQS